MTGLPAGVRFPNERVAGRVCPACAADGLLAFYAVDALPVHADTLHTTPAGAAAAPTAPVVLASCQTCALVTNAAFDDRDDPTPRASLEFLTALREAADDGPLTFEAHDARPMLECGAFCDVTTAADYFSRESLVRVFQRAGFEVLHAAARDHRLTLEAVPTGGQKRDMPTPTELRLAQQFVRVASVRLLEWAAFAEAARRSGRRSVIWGADAAAVAFVATLGVADVFAGAIDPDVKKHGRHLPGSGLRVFAPSALRTLRPDTVACHRSADQEAIAFAAADAGLLPEILTF